MVGIQSTLSEIMEVPLLVGQGDCVKCKKSVEILEAAQVKFNFMEFDALTRELRMAIYAAQKTAEIPRINIPVLFYKNRIYMNFFPEEILKIILCV